MTDEVNANFPKRCVKDIMMHVAELHLVSVYKVKDLEQNKNIDCSTHKISLHYRFIFFAFLEEYENKNADRIYTVVLILC